MGDKIIHDHRVTWAHTTRDIICKAIDRGQLPTVTLMFLAVLMFYRLPIDDAVDISKRFILALQHWCMIGWLAALVLMFGWYTHSRRQHEAFDKQCSRMDDENTRLQNALAAKASGHAHGRK